MTSKTQKFNPMEGVEHIPYDAPVVAFVDKLIEFARKKGSTSTCETSKDWETMEFLINGWATMYPRLARGFMGHMSATRSHANKFGSAREKGGAEIKHKLEIPQSLYAMITIIFPDQKWTKEWVNKFVKKYPGFGGGDNV